MLTIAVRSQNKYYQTGLLSLIEGVTQSEHVMLRQLDEDAKLNFAEKTNILFTDQVAVINIFKHQRSNKNDGIFHPEVSLHVIFNTRNMLLEEISTLISKCFRLSKMDYDQLIRNEYFRKTMSRNDAQLSNKESLIIQLMGQGYDTTNISKTLNCSLSTIYTHRRNATRKLGMINRLQFYKYTLLLKEFCCRKNIFLCL